MEDDSTKTIIKVVVLAGAALGIYWWLKQSGYWAQWFGGTAVVPVQPVQSGLPVVPVTTQPTTPATPTSTLPVSYQQAVTALTTAAGAPTQNFDQWAYWWQNTAPFAGAPTGYGTNGSITGTMIDSMIAAGGGDRTALITAQQWMNLMWAQMQRGVSGLQSFQPRMATGYGWNGMVN